MNIFPHFITGKFNHLTGQINNFDAFAHIKNEYFTAISQRSRLQNELTRLGYSHKKTSYFRMSNRYRTTRLNLFLETRDHRTIRSQNIPKTSSNKTSIRNAIQ